MPDMKRILLLCLWLPMVCVGQKSPFPVDSLTGKVTYREIVMVDSMSKKDLFRAAKKWIAESYKSANDVIQYEDLDEGKIIAKGNFEIENVVSYDYKDTTKKSAVKTKLFHLINIDAKDNKIRITFTNISRIVTIGSKMAAPMKPSALEDFRITTIEETESRMAIMEKDAEVRKQKAIFINESSKKIPVYINEGFARLLDDFKRYIISSSKESKW